MRVLIPLLLVACSKSDRSPLADPRPETFSLEAKVGTRVMLAVDVPADFATSTKIQEPYERLWEHVHPHSLTVRLAHMEQEFPCPTYGRLATISKDLAECSADRNVYVWSRIPAPIEGDEKLVAVCSVTLFQVDTEELRAQARDLCRSLRRR